MCLCFGNQNLFIFVVYMYTTMAICRQKRGDKVYLYRYRSVRDGSKVRHVYEEYLGVEGPDGKPVKKPNRVLDKVKLSSAHSYGAVALLWRICQELGLEEAIDSVVVKRKGYSAGRLLSLMAINKCLDPKSLSKFSNWYKTTALPDLTGIPFEVVSKNNLLSAMDAVCGEDEEEGEYDLTLAIERAIFERYKARLPESVFTSILYDITATLFHGGKCVLAEMGYNAFGRRGKKQVNIALVVTREYGIPLFHLVFRGSIKDVRTVGKMLEVFRQFGVGKTTLIWDRGMTSFETIKWAEEQKLGLISGLRADLLELEELFQLEISEEPGTLIKRFDGHGIYAIGREVLLFGELRKVVIYLNTQRREAQRLERNERLKKAMEELKQLSNRYAEEAVVDKKAKRVLKGLEEYLKVSYHRNGDRVVVGYELDEVALKHVANRDGKYALMSTDLSLSVEEILGSYFGKDVIEKCFRILKQETDLEPVRHRKSFRVKAYIFICFLAHLLYRILEYRLKNAGVKESLEEVLERLNEVEKLILEHGIQSSTRYLNLGTFETEVLKKLKMQDICPKKTINRTKNVVRKNSSI